MNNKGQVLVIFVILLPIFLLLLTFVVDYGLLSIEKRKVDTNTHDAIEYYLENIDDHDVYNKTMKLIESNLKDVEINIKDGNEFVEISVKSNYKSLFKNIIKEDLTIKYKGIKSSKEIIKG